MTSRGGRPVPVDVCSGPKGGAPTVRCGACGCRLSKTARYCPRCGAEADRGPEAAMAERRDRELLEKYRRRMRGDWT